ncbi:nucleotide-sugar transporter [Hirsutella rhossiliensis]|uniref:Nucleotide-sugar transporter domain-containing protein n=1 Tax=Hirsutella rhossiliensis TaxID=111463 RepID=A0A9P8SN59_9HYPO|nr:nucleotide-sugar transporter domain-containing protein [Hirsutella rhossiliensis]KAH0966846.1 nucleotide-sugar transporter domain-containing protein [Hirsutella rhossiliensis]
MLRLNLLSLKNNLNDKSATTAVVILQADWAILFFRPGKTILNMQPARGYYQALAAATGLVVIQVGIGIILKTAQTNGSYSFSTSGSVSFSELASGVGPRTRAAENHDFLPISSTDASDEQGVHNGQDALGDEYVSAQSKCFSATVPSKMDVGALWSYFRGEVTREKQFGFYILALCYTLINNSVFLSYHLADPGTVQLSKTGGTLITAIIMASTLKTAISRTQWAAVLLQVFGLILTQYKPGTGSTYPASTYAVLFFQIFISASSGVYNQHLLKSSNTSIHADNMLLYAFGAGINILCHIFIFCLTPNEPHFLQGYHDIRAILVIVSHIFIGLAITSVLKYADAVVKCLATAVATGILLYISPMLFGSELGAFVPIGTIIVFFASCLYMAYPAPQPGPVAPLAGDSRSPQRFTRHGSLILGSLTITTIGIVTFMAMFKNKAPISVLPENQNVAKNPTSASPFHDVLAMVRWNSAHPERIPYVMKYQPFFDTVHISIPDMMPGYPTEAYNWTHDQFPGTFTIYHQVAEIMQLALAGKSNIKGLIA